MLMVLCLAVTIGFRDTKHLANAQGKKREKKKRAHIQIVISQVIISATCCAPFIHRSESSHIYLLMFCPTFLYRVGGNNGYACHHMLNVSCYCALLEQEYLPCHWFPAFLWHN